ncbi:ATP/GTP-binding protein [Pedobacter sp. HMWF019]|uniref:discoidin domain-containing protein n=1 Tax=Pedobacter sp. HMWF019 TaxID=2056856 RepID=UPI000D3AB6B3|nr:discoidin domain-containing protein [Pedobacter sp. HMWF019]PTS95472.1 ATP/GTP-binding protein [Pedobacter sp. HMWF019]
MKKLHYSFILFTLLIIGLSCTKDGGYYDPQPIDKEYKGTTYEYLKSKPGIYDSLLRAIERVGAVHLLNDSSVTLFAVTNPGFQIAFTNLNNLYALSEKPSQSLSTIKYEQLDTMMAQYMIKGKYTANDLRQQDGLALTTARYDYPMHAKVAKTTSSGYITGGPEYILISDTRRSQFNKDWVSANTGSINIHTKNGIVHVMASDHVFGFDNFITRLTFNPPPPNLFKIIGGKQTVSRENGGGANGVEGSNNAIDGNSLTKFLLGWSQGNSVDITFELVRPAIAGAYTITSANDESRRDPSDWNLQGSMDGENWTYLDSKTNQVFEDRQQQKVFRFVNRAEFKFYRLQITRNNGADGMQFADWTVNLAK